MPRLIKMGFRSMNEFFLNLPLQERMPGDDLLKAYDLISIDLVCRAWGAWMY